MTEWPTTPVDMLARLVAFDTTSRDSNLALIRYVADFLGALGVAVTLTHDDDGHKANLFATLGSGTQGGIVLSGHTDVVPVDGQPWTSDPFALTAKGSRLYGRGTCDMKGFLATALALAPEIVRRRPRVPVHLALSYDEEVGCIGVNRLIAQAVRSGVRPRAVIVGEPTDMKVVDAHKGIYAFRTTVTGREAHSSLTHRGVNAILVAADLIGFLGRLADEMAGRAAPETGFDPPYTTVHVGTIKGGTALNIVPRRCAFAWEYRLMPGADEHEVIRRFEEHCAGLLPGLRARAEEVAIETVATNTVPGLDPEPGSAAETLAFALAGSNRAFKVPYGTEAGLFQRAGMATIVCGPGSIDQAHKPDEFVERAQIDACEAFLRRLIDHVCA
ncbi:MAG: acetylornithine deacetylase [Alphaproteobacteria bacterium]|nr:acetylornithine deacetylase [Alphaproteobacteria bacterium]